MSHQAFINRRQFMGMACLGAAALAAPPVVGLAASAHAQTAQAEVSLAGIREAATRLKGQVQRTPLVAGGLLSERCGANIVLKLENMQYTGSFKERGALNKMSTLTPMQRGKGVIAASTGNHAQGVAHHATRLGIPSTIVMPHGTPEMKIGHTRALGGEVVLQGDTFDDALAFALEKAANYGLTFIHPFEDPLIICGQGTIGLEIMHDLPNVDVLVAPVGGGGLISGCATAAKAMKPDLKVYGVEVANYAAMRQRLHGQPVQAGGETIAEGIAVRNVGERTFSIVENLVEDVLTVEEVNVERAIALLFELRKVVAEGAGAVGVAALLEHGELFAGKNVAVVVTGGNIDFRLFGTLLHRELARGGNLVNLRVVSPKGGSYAQLAELLAKNGAAVVSLQFDPVFHAASAKTPAYNLVLGTRDMRHAEYIVENLRDNGFMATIID